jgi:hypothetical protein
MTKTVQLDVDSDLIKKVQQVIDSRPSTVTDQVEEFVWIGMSVSEQLSKEDLANLLLGNCSISVIPKDA